MLTKDQLARIAHRNHISLGTQERDYLEHVFLSLLYARSQDFLFKGGTALRVAYNFGRYSEDLDFNSSLGSKKVRSLLVETTEDLETFGIKAEFRKVKVFRENGERSITGDVSYRGPLFTGKSATKGKIRVDVSLREEEAETKTVVVSPKYDDVSQFVLTALTLEEIFAEKVRALITRGKPRDLYDVWVILETGLQVDYPLINKKLALYAKKFDPEEFKKKVEKVQTDWERDLRDLLPQVAPFEEVRKEILERFSK